jgi:segregation and condensation protein B
MTTVNLKLILEAAIFAAPEPLTLDKMAVLFPDNEAPEKSDLLNTIESLQEDYKDRGVQLVKVASGYRFQAKSEFSQWLQRLWQQRPPRYSRALFETLALIAYKQPLTRAEIEEVRGVAVSSQIVKTLIDREWVRVVGHRDVPGRPALLATTKAFLDYFNLSALTDLPPLSELMDFDALEKQLGLALPEGMSIETQESEKVTENEQMQVSNDEIKNDELQKIEDTPSGQPAQESDAALSQESLQAQEKCVQDDALVEMA